MAGRVSTYRGSSKRRRENSRRARVPSGSKGACRDRSTIFANGRSTRMAPDFSSATLRFAERGEALLTRDTLEIRGRCDVANLGAMSGFAIARIAGDHSVVV